MTPIRLLLLVLAVLPLSAAEIFVAPDGNDAWSGTIAVSNAGRTDGPFATMAKAQQAVRALKTDAKGPITVHVSGGRYDLSAPLVFGPEDSGSAEKPVTWTAATGESPTISGGVRLSGFTADTKGRWTLTIPAVQRGEWRFSQLWVNGERRFRPVLPKGSYHFIAGEMAPSPAAAGKGFDRFRFAPGAFDAGWKNLADVEVLTFHQWEMSRFRVQAVDIANRAVQFTGHTINLESWTGLPTGWRYQVENVAEALDTPGEWYLDRPTGTLTYLPLPGEDIAKAEVIAPRTGQLLLIQGDPAKGRFVDHLHFNGLTFAHSAWTLKPEGYSFYQAEMIIPATVVATGLRDSSFTNCAIVHTGGYGLELGAGCKRNAISGCVLSDLSAGGVKIGEGGVNGDEAQVASHNTVSDCQITNGGRVHPAGIGVWIGQSHHNTVDHCEIADFYYSALSLGWTWGYGPSNGHHNVVSWCHLHRIGQGVLSDMGGIYNLGVSPGSTFHHNLIHDIESFSYGGWGLYTDEGSSGVTMEHNLVYRTTSSGFHQHYGRDNVIRNNVFAYGQEAQVMRTRDEPHLSFTMELNILLAHGTPLLGSNWNGDVKKFALNRNVYWDETGGVTLAGAALDDWRKKGIDGDSVVADPQFTDPAKSDFTLKPGSPALKLGFEPLDLRTAGVRADKAGTVLTAWNARPRSATGDRRAFPPKPPPPPPTPIFDTFEDTPVGQKAVGATTSEDGAVKAATIRVADDLAASGKRSLKFSDAPGQRNSFDPHLYYQPHFHEGVITASFKLHLDAGAVVYHEWRTSGNPYHSGPSFRIGADGTLNAAGRDLMRVPAGTWAAFVITAGVGKDAKTTWEMTVTLPSMPAQRFADLPCDKAFNALEWIGFVSDANQAAVFHLDDVEIAPAKK